MLRQLQHPVDIHGLIKKGLVAVAKLMRSFFGEIERQQGILPVLWQVMQRHNMIPVRFAIAKMGASGVLASLRMMSILRSPNAMVSAPLS